MTLSKEQREEVEDAIFDAHFSAQKYLENERDLHEKLMEVSVSDALELISSLKEEISNDPKLETYKLHLFVPLQLKKLVARRKESDRKK